MIAKVILGTMTNARKLVSIAERISCDVELCSGRYVVNAKSMLGVLSMPEFEYGELHIHTDEENECNQVLERLLEEGLLADTNDAAKRSLYDITTFGEILIDFTWQGVNEDGQTLFAQNPGGAPANVAVAVAKLGGHTAFIGKAGKDMHGEFLKSVLEKENVETEGMLLDEKYFTTLAFVNIDENGERTFSFARKPGADTRMEKEEIDVDILDKTHIFHVGSLSLTEQPARDTTHYAIRRAKEKGSIISYDPNYRASLWKDEETAKKQMRSLVPYVDIMKISDEETKLLTDKKSPEEATEILFRKGVKIVAVTLGSDGAYLYCKEGGVHIPGFVSKAVDTNGAGDSFWGGFLYCISKAGKRPEAFTMDAMSREYVLKQILYGIKDQYDAVIIDCMPSLGMITINALAASDEVLIPVEASYLPIKGLQQLLKTIGKVRKQINPKLQVGGILFTMVDAHTNDARNNMELLRNVYGSQIHIFDNYIPFSVRMKEAVREGQSIFSYDPKGKATEAYRRVTEEVLKDAI